MATLVAATAANIRRTILENNNDGTVTVFVNYFMKDSNNRTHDGMQLVTIVAVNQTLTQIAQTVVSQINTAAGL